MAKTKTKKPVRPYTFRYRDERINISKTKIKDWIYATHRHGDKVKLSDFTGIGRQYVIKIFRERKATAKQIEAIQTWIKKYGAKK